MNSLTRTEKLLLEAARNFNSTIEYEELIEMVLKLIASVANAEAALVFRVDHKRTDMRLRFMNCQTDCKMHIFEYELGKGVVGWVANYKEPVIINNAKSDPRYDAQMWDNVDVEVCSLLSVPLIGKGQMIGVIEVINKINGDFTEADLDVLIGLAHQIASAIDNANLYRTAKRDALEKNLLFEIGKKLSGSLTLNELLKEVLTLLMQAVEFTAGGIFIIDDRKQEIESLFTIGYEDCTEQEIHLKFGEGLVGHVADTGEPVLVSNVELDSHYIDLKCNTRSEMAVPIKIDDRVIGVFNLESDKVNAYDQNDLSLMIAFASQAAISIERAKLHEQIIAGQKIVEQLSIAREIQMTFLPKSELSLPGYDITGENIPSGEVGGDYYDFIHIVDQQIGIAIADVSGKGIPASLLMASFRASLIAEIRNNYSIRTICQKVNRLMCESVKPGNFVTAVYGVLDAKNHVLTFANCGHNQPILVRKNGEVEMLVEGGPIMGVTSEAIYEERPLYLGVGDIVILFTDGVVEVFGENEEQFGDERVIEIIKANQHKSTTEIRDAIYEAVNKFAAKGFNFDDFTMIVLKRTA